MAAASTPRCENRRCVSDAAPPRLHRASVASLVPTPASPRGALATRTDVAARTESFPSRSRARRNTCPSGDIAVGNLMPPRTPSVQQRLSPAVSRQAQGTPRQSFRTPRERVCAKVDCWLSPASLPDRPLGGPRGAGAAEAQATSAEPPMRRLPATIDLPVANAGKTKQAFGLPGSVDLPVAGVSNSKQAWGLPGSVDIPVARVDKAIQDVGHSRSSAKRTDSKESTHEDERLTRTVDAALEKTQQLFNMLKGMDLSQDQIAAALPTVQESKVATPCTPSRPGPTLKSTVEVPVAWMEQFASVFARLRDLEQTVERNEAVAALNKLRDLNKLPGKPISSPVSPGSEMSCPTTASPIATGTSCSSSSSQRHSVASELLAFDTPAAEYRGEVHSDSEDESKVASRRPSTVIRRVSAPAIPKLALPAPPSSPRQATDRPISVSAPTLAPASTTNPSGSVPGKTATCQSARSSTLQVQRPAATSLARQVPSSIQPIRGVANQPLHPARPQLANTHLNPHGHAPACLPAAGPAQPGARVTVESVAVTTVYNYYRWQY